MQNKSIISKTLSFLSDHDYRFLCLAKYGIFANMPDEEYLSKAFHARMGYDLNLDNPQTFNEKLQWLKLHDHNPEYTRLVDKYEVKQYITNIIGEEYIIPTLGVWNSFDEIDFDKLPDQFVLKCTHDSGGLVICKDKKTLDIRAAREKINRCLKRKFFYLNREWPYNNVLPRIIAEPYLTEKDYQGLTDYKIHCFHGEPKLILVCQDRFSEEGLAEDFFDTEWNHLDMQRPGQRHCSKSVSCPRSLDKILEISKIISQDRKFLRVDFYVINGQLKIGELTLYPASGFKPFDPPEWDMKLGRWIQINGNK